MPTFPSTFLPSAVSPPAIMDEMVQFQVDQGYSVRRAKHSRPRRRWVLSYLGKTVDEMRQIRDFLQQQRLGALDFAWHHPTALDKVLVIPATPMIVSWRHGLFSGTWIGMRNSPHPGLNEHVWQVTYFDPVTVTLNGTSEAGIAGTADVWVVVPHAVGIFQNDTYESPDVLMGPEQVAWPGRRQGVYNFRVTIEELF